MKIFNQSINRLIANTKSFEVNQTTTSFPKTQVLQKKDISNITISTSNVLQSSSIDFFTIEERQEFQKRRSKRSLNLTE